MQVEMAPLYLWLSSYLVFKNYCILLFTSD